MKKWYFHIWLIFFTTLHSLAQIAPLPSPDFVEGTELLQYADYQYYTEDFALIWEEDLATNEGPELAEFKYVAVCLDVAFENTSANAIVFDWDFGDGNISALQSPVHQYEQSGTYLVSLSAVSSDGTSDTVRKEITVDVCIGTEAETVPSPPLLYHHAYPNPAYHQLTIVFNDWEAVANRQNYELYLMNAFGQKVKTVKEISNSNTLNINNLQKGLYFYVLQNAQGKIVINQKIFIGN